MQNNVYTLKKAGKNKGSVNEDQNFLNRCLCQPVMRGYTAQIEVGGKNEWRSEKKFMECGNCCFLIPCCCMPHARVSKGGSTIAYLEVPYCPTYCCNNAVHVFNGDKKDTTQIQWKIESCQLNGHCLFGQELGCMCDCAKYQNFDIKDAGNTSKGQMRKVHNGFCNECCTTGDKYEINFPDKGKDHKATMLGAMQLMDMIFFENPAGI
eukprot:scpid103399/ scgid22396/ Phospholipid scramblase 1; Ca(2+)-dependent phospholipid scramblase 1; Transplantability-associated protein 1